MDLLIFLGKRVLQGALVLLVISIVVFAMFFVAPHNVARLLAGRQATAQTVADVARRLGLNRSVVDQYWSFLTGLLHGNLGYSFYSSEPVSSLIASRAPVTISVAVGAAIIWLVIGIGTGVLAARRPRSMADRSATAAALVFYSMPPFLLGLILLFFLFFQLHLAGIDLFPGSGYVGLLADPAGWAQHMILPWFTLALVTATTYERLTRGALLDVLGEDYIRTARAKGLTERRVVYRHGSAGRPHAGGHPVRDRPGHPVGRRHRRGERFRAARTGCPGRFLGDQRGPAGDHRAGHVGVGFHRRSQHRGRCRLRRPGPQGPSSLTARKRPR